jgi:hypothetical protein
MRRIAWSTDTISSGSAESTNSAAFRDPAHGLGGGNVEVGSAFPCDRSRSLQPQVGLVHQLGRLQAVVGPLAGELFLGRPPELCVDQRDDFTGSLGIAGTGFREQASEGFRIVRHQGSALIGVLTSIRETSQKA